MPVSWSLRPCRAHLEIVQEPFHRWLAQDGSVWASFYRLDAGYLIRFPGLADFQISDDGLEVQGFPLIGVSAQTTDHLYLNQVQPLALSRQMRLVLHGSAVEIGATAIAFLGRSGRGKSTLAASFAANGTRFITDDGLLLEQSGTGVVVEPSHPSIRLWEDSRNAVLPNSTLVAPPVQYTPKVRMLAGSDVPFCPEPRNLRQIYVLGGASEAICISSISARDAVIEAVRNCFLLDIDEHTALKHHYQQLLALAARVPFFLLEYPREFERLEGVRRAVIAHAAFD